MKLLLLSTALIGGLVLPTLAFADTPECVKIDKGGYSTFERGCDLDGSVGNVTVAVKADEGDGPTEPEPVDPEEPTDPVDPEPEPEPETPTEPDEGDTRPGHGYGDDNHDHEGPPGLEG